jgi:hypothetical protein
MVLAGAALVAFAGAAAAMDHHAKRPVKLSHYYGLYQNPVRGLPLDQVDQAQFSRSGTIGREGLGESPRHPEGPGNVSD